MAPPRKAYRALARRDGAWWTIRVPELRGVHAQVRRLDDADEMAHTAIALFLECPPDSIDVSVGVELDREAAGLVERMVQARAAAEEAAREASKASRDAVAVLASAGLSGRDIASIVGISHQRVAQLARPAAGSAQPTGRPQPAGDPSGAATRARR